MLLHLVTTVCLPNSHPPPGGSNISEPTALWMGFTQTVDKNYQKKKFYIKHNKKFELWNTALSEL